MVLAEAMNYKKAIVSASNTAICEVVENERTGLLVPTLDHKSFAQAILKLLNNEKRRSEMGILGYKKVQKYFRWNLIARQYEKVYESAINNK
jgi:glycosyltransferase involved in cell wall biosynthesis